MAEWMRHIARLVEAERETRDRRLIPVQA